MNIKKIYVVLVAVFAVAFTSCNGQKNTDGTYVLLETTEGNIRIHLFDDTPGHRDNFVKNVKDSLYNGVTFHRVIRNFMIQTGDPYTRQGSEPQDTTVAAPTIPAEIRYPAHYHKRGMVAAAREGDDENPQKASDKFQFYIVTGKCYNDESLTGFEDGRYEMAIQHAYDKLVEENAKEIDAIRATRNRGKLSDYLDSLLTRAKYYVAENPPVSTPANVNRDYRSVGGAPFLDNEYTVFGEVVEGMKIVETIEKYKTDSNDKPLRDVRVIKATIEE